MMGTIPEFQNEIAVKLTSLLADFEAEVITEWAAFPQRSGWYSPRLDIAAGPFSTTIGESKSTEYDAMVESTALFLTTLIDFHEKNISEFRHTDDLRVNHGRTIPTIDTLRDSNRNSRCYIAIEIENAGSRKHFLGGLLNSCALGRIGIAIGWDTEAVRTLVRLQSYWDFLTAVGKQAFPTGNLIILSPEQMEAAVAG